MSFCDQTCMVCDETNCIAINYSGHHKLCITHIKQFLFSPYINCFKCNSKVAIIKDCLKCNHDISCLVVQGCSHIRCLMCEEYCKMCLVCTSCHKNSQKLTYGKCENCSKPQNPINFNEFYCNCGNSFIKCEYCTNFVCLACNFNRISCKNCLNFIQNKKICPNCNKNSILIPLNCSHIGCVTCKDQNNCKKCSNITKKCEYCEGQSDLIHIKSSNSYICIQCNIKFSLVPNTCTICEKNIEKFDFLPCDHICITCNSKSFNCNLCYPYFCINCEKKCKQIVEKDCKHVLCLECVEKSEDCAICSRSKQKSFCCSCNVETDNFVETECKHKMCLECFNKEAKCNLCITNYKLCDICNNLSETALMSCNHRTCLECMQREDCAICSRSKQKSFCCSCNVETDNFVETECKHKMCLECFNKEAKCNLCISNYKLCDICNNLSETTLMSCNHRTCLECMQRENTCKKCFPAIRQPCSSCCKSISNKELVDLPCKHHSCLQCFEKNISCKECYQNFVFINFSSIEKSTPNNFKENTKQTFTNSGLKNYCIDCKTNSNVEKLNCGHFLCCKCKTDPNDCKLCKLTKFNNQCPNCSEITEEFKNFDCKHYGCSKCFFNK